MSKPRLAQEEILTIREYLRRGWSSSRIMYVLGCEYDDVAAVRFVDATLEEAQRCLDAIRPEPAAVTRARRRELCEATSA